MGNIKIAFLCNGYGLVHRGAEQFTYQFYQHLKDVFDIDIYGVGKTGHSIQIPSKHRDEFVIPWRNGRAYLESYLFGKKAVTNILNQNTDYDIIFNNAGFFGSFWCHRYRKKTETPFITRARGGGHEEKIHYMFKPDLIVFLTRENERSTKKINPSVNTMVIPNAIDTSTYSMPQLKEPDITKGVERPLFLGTSAFEAYKRNDLIIDAVAQLEKGSLLLLGDGSLKEKTIRYGKEKLQHRFIYGGVIPHSERDKMISVYQHADVFVQAARKEAFGVVFLEAMASGLPVVTQHDERRKEIIGDAGILINCSDQHEFSNALDQAAMQPWDEQPIQQAKKFDWTNIKQTYITAIDEIVTNR